MMNNCHFRVKVHPIKHKGKIALQFEHPTVAANGPGGWMVPKKESMSPVPRTQEAQKEEPKVAAAPASSTGATTFTLEEIAKHKTEESAWFIHDNKVYDATTYLADHPGGAESILITAGQDATEEFDAIHSTKARGMLAKYLIGSVGDANSSASSVSSQSATSSEAVTEVKSLVALDKTKRIPFKLVEKEILSHDTRR